ncbi:hypothetical protein ACTZWW_19710 [Salinarimonas sp. NSM]|uniref:hypothetical protein n=1 Tax=Salinarimonas sp. NSM TaxID=3458003 RepID=UPI004035927D
MRRLITRRSTNLAALSLAALAAGGAQAQSIVAPATQAAEAFSDARIIPLGELDFEPAAFGLWSGHDLLDADLLGPSGEDIGDVEDILVTTDGWAVAVVVELDAFLEFDEPMLSIPLSVLEILPEEGAVRAPIEPDAMQLYSAFDVRTLTARIVSDQVAAIADDDLDDVVTGAGLFLLEDALLGEYAPLGDGARRGYVHDILFAMEGEVDAVVISATAGPFDDLAVPWMGPPARE